MNMIETEILTPKCYFTEDLYMGDTFFIYPKNLEMTDVILDLLDKWYIDDVMTEGQVLNLTVEGEDGKKEGDAQNGESSSDVISAGKPGETVAKTELGFDKNEPIADVYKRWSVTVIEFFKSVLVNQRIDKNAVVKLLDEIRARVRFQRNDIMMHIGQPIEGVPNIYRKAVDVTVLCHLLAKTLQLNTFTEANLLIAALFHDIGMLKIPKAILNKATPLTKEELAVIQNHTIVGFKYLKAVNYPTIIASGALQHHERVDGKGYPNRTTSERITDVAKIISVADAYCAAIAEKTFRDSLHAKDAMQDLLGKGGIVYDQAVLKALVKTISFYPVGCLVVLSDGNVAQVTGTTAVAMRPIVQKATIGENEITLGETIDLTQVSNVFIKGIYKR